MTRLAVIDPLTLLGRELLELLPRYPSLGGELVFVHTDEDDEHKIAELGGGPGLVPPLDSPAQLHGCDAVLSLAVADTPRIDVLESFLDAAPAVPFVDAGRLERFWDRLEPLAGPAGAHSTRAARVAHPSLLAAVAVVEPLDALELEGLSVAAVEPVSSLGAAAVDGLASQATARLSGVPVAEQLAGQVLAFGAVDLPAELLVEDLARMLGGRSVAVCRSLTGVFHGHQAHLGLRFAQPVRVDELVELWRGSTLLALADPPLRLEDVINREAVLLGLPHVSADGRTVAVTAMVDGMSLGGALSALEILQSFL